MWTTREGEGFLDQAVTFSYAHFISRRKLSPDFHISLVEVDPMHRHDMTGSVVELSLGTRSLVGPLLVSQHQRTALGVRVLLRDVTGILVTEQVVPRPQVVSRDRVAQAGHDPVGRVDLGALEVVLPAQHVTLGDEGCACIAPSGDLAGEEETNGGGNLETNDDELMMIENEGN